MHDLVDRQRRDFDTNATKPIAFRLAQLRTLAAQVDVPVYSAPDDVVASGAGDPVEVARGALAEARRLGRDVVIVDTAGRLAIDAELMEQVRQISA